VIPADWQQEGHLATKTLHQFPFIQHGTQWMQLWHSQNEFCPMAQDKTFCDYFGI